MVLKICNHIVNHWREGNMLQTLCYGHYIMNNNLPEIRQSRVALHSG